MPTNTDPRGVDFLNQRGPTLELIRSIDWSKTPIGPQNSWPQSLRSALSICVHSNFPIAIYWGRELVLLYNEAWSPIPGNKHPWAFGKPAIEVWPEIWPDIEPQFEKAFTGIPGGSKDALLPMQRHGYTEECYFDFTFTPIYGESGKVEGIFNAVIETTYRVINERRSTVLQRLGEAISRAATPSDVFAKAARVLREAKADIPFFYIYELESGTTKLRTSHPLMEDPSHPWPAEHVMSGGTSYLVEDITAYLPPLPAGHWPEPPTQALIVPINSNDGQVFGFIVGGVSPRRQIDKDYGAFYESLSSTISAELNTLQSLAKERERVFQFTRVVTEQRRANLKLKESEERFRVLANSIPQFVWIADAAGQIEYMSDQWEAYSATTPEVGRASFSSFIHPEDIDNVREKWKMSMQTKQPWTAEFRLKNIKTGEYRWFFGHTVPLLDENKNVLKWIGSSSDIHSQKSHSFELEAMVAERTSELIELNHVLKARNDELSKAQTFLQTVLDSSVELVTAFDQNLNFTFVNKRLSALSTTPTPEQLMGKNLLDVRPGFEKTESYDQLMRALKGETIHIKARRPDANNSLVFETFIIPLRRNGVVNGVVTMQRDITSVTQLAEQLRESNEQLKRSNEDLQQFAHVTSHDLKEPVRKIRTYANILKDAFPEYLPDQAKVYLAKIDKATARISAMIDGVLQYATIDSPDQSLQEVDLNEVIKNILEDLEIPIKEYNATIAFDDLPTVKGYPTLIYQLFYNLINNSLKFRKKDIPPKIELLYAHTTGPDNHDLDGDYFSVIVKDNGVGFDENFSEKIFESFARLHSKDVYEGTGLGLALCRRIALRHHGHIKASSQFEQGATFTVLLPKSIRVGRV